jgi:hypothetical protein
MLGSSARGSGTSAVQFCSSDRARQEEHASCVGIHLARYRLEPPQQTIVQIPVGTGRYGGILVLSKSPSGEPIIIPFADRRQAGKQLATQLAAFANRSDVLVLALPRGGVPVAFEVARAVACR